MRWRVRSIREVCKSAPGDEQPVSLLRSIGALFVPGFELAAADGPPVGPVSMAAMWRDSDEEGEAEAPAPGSGQRGSKHGREPFRGRKPLNNAQSGPENDEFAQPSD